jgi:cyclic pyranopterin phosphate synthase
LIPLCHSLPLDWVDVVLEQLSATELEVRCTARTRAATGVEMEAMVGASLAALTVYDMSKGLDKGIVLGRVELVEKRGGKSGLWRRPGTNH